MWFDSLYDNIHSIIFKTNISMNEIPQPRNWTGLKSGCIIKIGIDAIE